MDGLTVFRATSGPVNNVRVGWMTTMSAPMRYLYLNTSNQNIVALCNHKNF